MSADIITMQGMNYSGPVHRLCSSQLLSLGIQATGMSLNRFLTSRVILLGESAQMSPEGKKTQIFKQEN